MYEARQNKEKVSRRIDGGGMARQREKKLHMHLFENALLHKKVLQCRIFEDENGLFYSDKDPNQKFKNKAEAEAHEYFLSQNSNRRPPTLFTFTHTPETRMVNSLGIPQGPHTLGYAATENALDFAMQNQNPQTLLNEQCLSPEEWKEEVKKKLPVIPTNLQPRIERAYERHDILWRTANEDMGKKDMQQFRFCVSGMMQLDPRATYGWETTKKNSHAALKGKGENHDIEDDRNVDTGGLKRGTSDSEEFIYGRRQMMDGDYNEEDFEEDSEDIDQWNNGM